MEKLKKQIKILWGVVILILICISVCCICAISTNSTKETQKKESITNQEYLEAGLAIEYMNYTYENYLTWDSVAEDKYIRACKNNQFVSMIANESHNEGILASDWVQEKEERTRAKCKEHTKYVEEILLEIQNDPLNFDYDNLRIMIQEGKVSKTSYLIKEYENNNIYKIKKIKIAIEEEIFNSFQIERYKTLICLAYGDMIFRNAYKKYQDKEDEIRVKTCGHSSYEKAKYRVKYTDIHAQKKFEELRDQVFYDNNLGSLMYDIHNF